MLVPVLFSIWDMAWVLIVGGVGIVCGLFVLKMIILQVWKIITRRRRVESDLKHEIELIQEKIHRSENQRKVESDLKYEIELIQEKIHRLENRRKQGKKN